MASSAKGGKGSDKLRYTTLTLRTPGPYAKRVQQVALSLDLSVAGLLRAGVESLAKDHPDLPQALVEDLLRLGSQINTRPVRLYEAFDPDSVEQPGSTQLELDIASVTPAQAGEG
jgi:hypothetical protein